VRKEGRRRKKLNSEERETERRRKESKAQHILIGIVLHESQETTPVITFGTHPSKNQVKSSKAHKDKDDLEQHRASSGTIGKTKLLTLLIPQQWIKPKISMFL
jgi:hypothetical protein